MKRSTRREVTFFFNSGFSKQLLSLFVCLFVLHIPVDEWSMWSTRPSLQKERTVHGSTLTIETWRVIQVSSGGEIKKKNLRKIQFTKSPFFFLEIVKPANRVST